jgi:hypothetical protein
MFGTLPGQGCRQIIFQYVELVWFLPGNGSICLSIAMLMRTPMVDVMFERLGIHARA